MKKRICIAACAITLLIGCLVVSSMAATTKSGYCEACKQSVTWEPIVFGTVAIPEGQTTVHKHYYVTADTTNASQIIVQAGVTACIDLNGKDLVFPKGRAFLAYQATASAPAAISIQDSVGGATVTSHSYTKGDLYASNSNNGAGGIAWVADYCTMNIYGGTYNLDVKTPESMFTTAGGAVAIYPGGTLNLYEGIFNGATVKVQGGTIDIQERGTLNLYGGMVKSGSAPTGSCVNVRATSCKVRLSGDAQVDEIYFAYNTPTNFIIDGAYTGKANLAYRSGITLAEGTAIGTLVNNGAISGGDLYCTNGSGYGITANGTSLKLTAPSVADVRYECPHCQTFVKWEPFTTTAPVVAGTYHYYLDKDYGTSAAKQYTINGGAQVCLDLQGHSYSTNGRTLNISGSGSVLSVMDTVGGGSVNGKAGSNNPGGGTVSVGGSNTFNLYAGTLTFTHDPNASFGGTGRGGVIQATGTLNVYGGKIVGGEVVDCTYEFTGIEGAGGAVYASGALNILGGEITSGKAPESGAGPCIYVASSSSKVTLGGDAKVEDIYFTTNNSTRFVVNSDFTGTAGISYEPSVVLHQGLAVGVCSAAEWKGTVNCTSDMYPTALPENGSLVLSAYPVGTVAAANGQGYQSLQEAIDAAPVGGLVEMLKPVQGDITVNKNIYLQMNTCSINGTVTVAEGCTLYGMDSATIDFTVADGRYGRITQVIGAYAGASADAGHSDDSYLAVNENGVISFHCVRLQIYAMTLRVDATDDRQEPGLYYKSYFRADEKAAPLISTFGVALSVYDIPDAENMDETCRYTEISGFESGPYGNLGNSTSTLLKGILKSRNSDDVNLRNMKTDVYGRAYAKTADGQCIFGTTVSRSLMEQLEGIDQIVPTLSETQVSAVVNMYTKFKSVMADIKLPGIAEAVQTNEEGTLKVLVLGNSHGLDATNLLYEVFHNEAPEQKVVIAALYYSGCNMEQHNDYLTNNKKVYTYHKNDGSQPNRTWVVKDSTCLEALQDEQWDIILMQQMNHRAAMDSNYTNSWKVVADYLLNNQDIAPKLGFHMTWTNPDDYALYLNDNAPYKNPSPASWRSTHEQYWSTDGKYDQSKQYTDIVRCVQQYLVDDTTLVGRPYDLIIPSATAVEYAQDVCGRTQPEIYRDYTHMNDYGRLICAYLWYAQIMELDEITEVNTDAVPAVLKHKNSQFPVADANGAYAITDDMKADLIESVNWALKNPFSLPEE